MKRLAELPAVVADATAERGPQAIPAYAIRVADDFHRFYHEHRVLESDQAGVPARALPRDADGDRTLARPRRRRGAGADVTLRRDGRRVAPDSGERHGSSGLKLGRRGSGRRSSLALGGARSLGGGASAVAIAVFGALCGHA